MFWSYVSQNNQILKHETPAATWTNRTTAGDCRNCTWHLTTLGAYFQNSKAEKPWRDENLHKLNWFQKWPRPEVTLTSHHHSTSNKVFAPTQFRMISQNPMTQKTQNCLSDSDKFPDLTHMCRWAGVWAEREYSWGLSHPGCEDSVPWRWCTDTGKGYGN